MLRLSLALCLIALVSNGLDAQNLAGTVLDSNGAPLPGASVVADGVNGEFTDGEGRYSLTLAPGPHQIVCSYIGYVAQKKAIDINNQAVELNFTLADDAVLIEDVVVVGYGVQRKKEVTGSIVKVDAKQITGVQTPSF
jgi:hypothetical protein